MEEDEEEIILLARKGAKEGTLSEDESDWVTNALRLDEVKVSEIMTPAPLCSPWKKTLVQKVFDQYPNVPFARIQYILTTSITLQVLYEGGT